MRGTGNPGRNHFRKHRRSLLRWGILLPHKDTYRSAHPGSHFFKGLARERGFQKTAAEHPGLRINFFKSGIGRRHHKRTAGLPDHLPHRTAPQQGKQKRRNERHPHKGTEPRRNRSSPMGRKKQHATHWMHGGKLKRLHTAPRIADHQKGRRSQKSVALRKGLAAMHRTGKGQSVHGILKRLQIRSDTRTPAESDCVQSFHPCFLHIRISFAPGVRYQALSIPSGIFSGGGSAPVSAIPARNEVTARISFSAESRR